MTAQVVIYEIPAMIIAHIELLIAGKDTINKYSEKRVHGVTSAPIDFSYVSEP